jgi:hypothetical protein
MTIHWYTQKNQANTSGTWQEYDGWQASHIEPTIQRSPKLQPLPLRFTQKSKCPPKNPTPPTGNQPCSQKSDGKQGADLFIRTSRSLILRFLSAEFSESNPFGRTFRTFGVHSALRGPENCRALQSTPVLVTYLFWSNGSGVLHKCSRALQEYFRASYPMLWSACSPLQVSERSGVFQVPVELSSASWRSVGLAA